MSIVYNPPSGATYDEYGNLDPDGEFDEHGMLPPEEQYSASAFSDEEIDEAFRTAVDGTDEDEVKFAHDNRLNLLTQTYQLADSILARGAIVTQRVSEPNRREATWTDGKIVYVNDAQITATDFDNIENLNGANFHELSHILFSPRRGTAFIKDIQARGMEQTYVILEDQRIETLLSIMYPSTTPWLSSQILRWILKSPSVEEYGYIYIRGRRYLDGKLRGLLRSTFCRSDLLPEIDRIIDAYRKLVFPRDFAIATQLIEEFHEILKDLMPPQDGAANHTSGYESPSHGHAVTQATQKALQGQEGEGEGESEPGEGEGEGAGEGNEGEGDSQGNGAGAGNKDDKNTGANNKPNSAAQNLAKQGLEQHRNNKAVQKDVQQKQRQIGATEGDPFNKSIKTSNRPVSDQGIQNRNRLVKVLDKLVMAADPGWLTREHSGKLNVSRFMAERDFESAFDQWEEGVHDATDMEVVILTDDSGSMGSNIYPALEASWSVKSALDTLGIPVTSAVFSNSLRTLYTRSEKAQRTSMKFVFQGGGTEVIEGLEMATRVFMNSKKKQKILIIFTDGSWYSARDKYGMTDEDYIAKMKKMGVLTSIGFISGYYDKKDSAYYKEHFGHNAEVFGVVTPQTMLEFMKGLVTTSIRNTIRKGLR